MCQSSKGSMSQRNGSFRPTVLQSAVWTHFNRTTTVVYLFLLLSLFILFSSSSRNESFFSSLRHSPAFWKHPARDARSSNTTGDQAPQLHSNSESCHLANSSNHTLARLSTNLPAVLREYAIWHKRQRACLLNPGCKRKPKLLVFRCPNHGYCLGLGDRMRGVLFTLFYAILTKRLFIMAWPEEPYPLQVALSPASIDWTPPADFSFNPKWPYLEVAYCHKTACNWREPKVLHSAHIDLNGTDNYLRIDDLNVSFGKHDVISLSLRVARRHSDQTRRIKDMFPGLDDTVEDFGTMEKEVYRMMFKPSEKVLRKMKSLGIKDDEAYYGVHIRTGIDVNEDDEKRFDYINSHLDQTVENFLDCLEIADEKTTIQRVFLASDSTKAKEVFAKKAKERGLEVKVFTKETIHFLKVNFQEEHPFEDMCDRYLTVFADLYMLSRSQILVSTKSHFSDFAHALSDNVNFKHICYRPERGLSPRRICKPSAKVIRECTF